MDFQDFDDLNSKNFKLGFIGLGLIGGSLAKAFREAFPSSTIVGFNRRELPRELAYEDGTCDIVTDKIDDNFKGCDYIFLVLQLNIMLNISSYLNR